VQRQSQQRRGSCLRLLSQVLHASDRPELKDENFVSESFER